MFFFDSDKSPEYRMSWVLEANISAMRSSYSHAGGGRYSHAAYGSRSGERIFHSHREPFKTAGCPACEGYSIEKLYSRRIID